MNPYTPTETWFVFLFIYDGLLKNYGFALCKPCFVLVLTIFACFEPDLDHDTGEAPVGRASSGSFSGHVETQMSFPIASRKCNRGRSKEEL